MNRCPVGIRFGTIATRCSFPAGHDGDWHIGRGLYEYQTIQWMTTDRRCFDASRIVTDLAVDFARN